MRARRFYEAMGGNLIWFSPATKTGPRIRAAMSLIWQKENRYGKAKTAMITIAGRPNVGKSTP